MELLETNGITKSYDSREIIRNISIRLKEGEIVSLLGLSGSGKSAAGKRGKTNCGTLQHGAAGYNVIHE